MSSSETALTSTTAAATTAHEGTAVPSATVPPGTSQTDADADASSKTQSSNKTGEATASSDSSPPERQLQPLDFVGSSRVFKDLFSLSQSGVHHQVDTRPLSIAVHNLGDGILLLDHEPQQKLTSTVDQEHQQDEGYHPQPPIRSTAGEGVLSIRPDEELASRLPDAEVGEDQNEEEKGEVREDALLPLVALSSSDQIVKEQRESALALVNAWIDDSSRHRYPRLPNDQRGSSGAWIETRREGELLAEDLSSPTMTLPTPDAYVQKAFTGSSSPEHVEPAPPREYLSWKFQDMDLCVGSEALIYRAPPSSTPGPSTTSTALTLRVEDTNDLKALLERHRQTLQSTKPRQMSQQKPVSYLEAAQRQPRRLKPSDSTDSTPAQAEQAIEPDTDDAARTESCQAPKMSTTDSPPPSLGAGTLLSAGGKEAVVVEPVAPLQDSSVGRSKDKDISPVSLVVDAYLDNIMANVPQLALCLREKGYIQAVKLLKTSDIPVGLMHASTLDTSTPFDVFQSSPEMEKIFSPRVMEIDAAALLRFLQSNCRTENSTYLLRREAGQTNVRLYDISSLSAHGHRKWAWWLATMSYRFATRLRHLSFMTKDSAHARTFRDRQRSLLQNTLDLLEVLADIDGEGDEKTDIGTSSVNHHESLAAAIRENLADTFLGESGEQRQWHRDGIVERQDNESDRPKNVYSQERPKPPVSGSGFSEPISSAFSMPYGNMTADALNKAHDNLVAGIQVLWPVLEGHVPFAKKLSKNVEKEGNVELSRVETIDSASEFGDSDDGSFTEKEKTTDQSSLMQIDAVGTQLFGLHHKLINVSLRLAEIHLKNYWSSSAMQELRTSARRISASLYLIRLLASSDSRRQEELSNWLQGTKLQYTWLWEHCGHFARSFAADVLWRDRGHASGDDVCAVLRDVQRAFAEHDDESDQDLSTPFYRFIRRGQDPFARKTNGMVSLTTLNPIVGFQNTDSILNMEETVPQKEAALIAAKGLLDKQGLIQKDHRKVLCASCIAYGRSIEAYEDLELQKSSGDLILLNLLQKRLGDACNETGNMLLNELRIFLGSTSFEGDSEKSSISAAGPLLSSAEFWFLEALEAFEGCRDPANLALVRCNLCQCYKIRANAMFDSTDSTSSSAVNADGRETHAERCLSQAIHHLEQAHATLGQRDVSPRTWDMVSAELAATLLVLGVRRRQSLIGSGNIPVIAQALRLSPGKERSIVDPMEKALRIYEEFRNFQQASAVHYQLALFYSKIWTCQRDEAKTREKLSAAFRHYSQAHAFFSHNIPGNESTFCLLCLDMASLYATMSGSEGLSKALLHCLDTVEVFSESALNRMLEPLPKTSRAELLQKLETLAVSVEERVFKLLRSLTKVEEDGGGSDKTVANRHKELYRVGLQAKMTGKVESSLFTGATELDEKIRKLLAVHRILYAIQTQPGSSSTGTNST